MPKLSDFPLVNKFFAESFPTHPPARMTINAPLPLGLKFSIGCVAALADGTLTQLIRTQLINSDGAQTQASCKELVWEF